MKKTTLVRNDYGELCISLYLAFGRTTDEDVAMYRDAAALVEKAAAKGKIDYARQLWQEGEFVHHEIYDIRPDAKAVVVCVRYAESSKYGVKTTKKNYYTITKCGRGVRVTDAKKSIVAKAAKASVDPIDERARIGAVYALVTGQTKRVRNG